GPSSAPNRPHRRGAEKWATPRGGDSTSGRADPFGRRGAGSTAEGRRPMSLRNRARRLQHASGSTYQQALARLRALGASPAELARRNRWPLARCDRFLADRALDEEWRAVAARSRRVDEARCVCCGAIYFAGDDERRAQLDACPACRAPIEVLEVERVTRADVLGDACEELRVTANARAVLLVGRRGRELALGGPIV